MITSIAAGLINAAGGCAADVLRNVEELSKSHLLKAAAAISTFHLKWPPLFSSGRRLQKAGDEFVTAEKLLLVLALAEGTPSARVLNDSGATPQALEKAIKLMRKGRIADSSGVEGQYDALQKYTQNLNQLALNGKIDPVIGRDDEIRRAMQVLSRRTKNNPVLIGEPGVGKTAIAEGLAQRIVKGDVPEGLREKRLLTLDLGALIAGAKFRGEFEERLKAVLHEVSAATSEIVLFIDELHTLVGAGAQKVLWTLPICLNRLLYAAIYIAERHNFR